MAKVIFLREPHIPVVHEGACLIHHATRAQVEPLWYTIVRQHAGDFDKLVFGLAWWTRMMEACHE